MRVVYITLGLFILFNIGVACRTPAQVAEGCEPVGSGLVHCAPQQDDRG